MADGVFRRRRQVRQGGTGQTDQGGDETGRVQRRAPTGRGFARGRGAGSRHLGEAGTDLGPPQQVKQGAGAGGFHIALIVRPGDAHQVQGPAGPGDGYVEQALAFVAGPLRLQAAQGVVDAGRAGGGAAPVHRGDDQMGLGAIAGDLVPQQQPGVVVAAALVQAGQEHGVEFQTLGFVDGHELQAGGLLARVRRGEQGLGFGLEGFRVEAALGHQFVHKLEEGLGGGLFAGVGQGGGSAEEVPGAFDPAPGDGAGPLRRRPRPGWCGPAPGGSGRREKGGPGGRCVLHQLPQGGLVVIPGQGVEVGQGEAAPGGAQQG